MSVPHSIDEEDFCYPAPHLSLSLLLPQEQATSKDLSLQVSSLLHDGGLYTYVPLCLVRRVCSLRMSFAPQWTMVQIGLLCFCSRSAPVLWVCTNRGCFILTLPPQTNIFMHGTEVPWESVCKLLCPWHLGFSAQPLTMQGNLSNILLFCGTVAHHLPGFTTHKLVLASLCSQEPSACVPDELISLWPHLSGGLKICDFLG